MDSERTAESARNRVDLTRFRSGEHAPPCDRCGAQPGQPCRTPGGRTTYAHGNRWQKVMGPNTVGYAQGLRDALDLGPEQASRQLEWIVKRLDSMREEGRL